MKKIITAGLQRHLDKGKRNARKQAVEEFNFYRRNEEKKALFNAIFIVSISVVVALFAICLGGGLCPIR